MNDKDYEMIGESIWDTYRNMASILAEKTAIPRPVGRMVYIAGDVPRHRRELAKQLKYQRTSGEKAGEAGEATEGPGLDINEPDRTTIVRQDRSGRHTQKAQRRTRLVRAGGHGLAGPREERGERGERGPKEVRMHQAFRLGVRAGTPKRGK